MIAFKLCEGVAYTVETAGVAVASPSAGKSYFINYPEAAVWSVLAENRYKEKELKKISIILGKEEAESMHLIQKCLDEWRAFNLIY